MGFVCKATAGGEPCARQGACASCDCGRHGQPASERPPDWRGVYFSRRERRRCAMRRVTASAALIRCSRTLCNSSSNAISSARAPLASQAVSARPSPARCNTASASLVDTNTISRNEPASARKRRESFSLSRASCSRSQWVATNRPRPRRRAGSRSHTARSLSFQACVLTVHHRSASTWGRARLPGERSSRGSANPGRSRISTSRSRAEGKPTSSRRIDRPGAALLALRRSRLPSTWIAQIAGSGA